jgi:hypothetical protein
MQNLFLTAKPPTADRSFAVAVAVEGFGKVVK